MDNRTIGIFTGAIILVITVAYVVYRGIVYEFGHRQKVLEAMDVEKRKDWIKRRNKRTILVFVGVFYIALPVSIAAILLLVKTLKQ